MSPCADCGTETVEVPDQECEYYMVWDDVWKEAGMTRRAGQFLCIGCLESRLGRQLTSADFPHVLVNARHFGPQSDRLADRLERRLSAA